MFDIFSIDTLEVLRWIVFSLFIVAAVGVTFGVFWENEDFEKTIRHRGWKLLVWSLGAEILLTIGVFAIDGTIASKQRTTIAQLLSHRSLSQDQKDRLAAVSKSFPSLSFVTATVQDDEAWGFAMDIGAELKSDGWNWVPCPGGVPPLDARPASCMTIAAGIQIDAPDSLKPVGNALVAALKDPDVIGMDNVQLDQNANPSTMIVIVGSKR